MQKVPKKFEVFPAPSYKIRKNNLAPHKKRVGGIYTITNTAYHKFVRVGDQKWEMVEITIEIFFFFFNFLLEICIHFFLYRELASPTEKNSPPPKVSIVTQNPNFS